MHICGSKVIKHSSQFEADQSLLESTGNYLNNFYDTETGENYFEVVPESAFEFYIAMMVPKTSPFFDRFNQVVSMYLQSGLYDYNQKKALDDNEKVWIYRVNNGFIPRRKSQALNVGDLQDAFKLYLILLGVSLIVFVVEIFIRFLTSH